MLDPLFPFIDSEIVENDWFNLIDGVELIIESPKQLIEQGSINAALSSKVKEIIEEQWGKRIADLQDLYIGQFHERLIKGDEVSYQSTDRSILRAKFLYTREPRRIIFSFTV